MPRHRNAGQTPPGACPRQSSGPGESLAEWGTRTVSHVASSQSLDGSSIAGGIRPCGATSRTLSQSHPLGRWGAYLHHGSPYPESIWWATVTCSGGLLLRRVIRLHWVGITGFWCHCRYCYPTAAGDNGGENGWSNAAAPIAGLPLFPLAVG